MDTAELKHIEIGHLCASARKGSAWGEVMREAIVLAASEWRNVDVLFNENIYHVRPNDLLVAVEKDRAGSKAMDNDPKA